MRYCVSNGTAGRCPPFLAGFPGRAGDVEMRPLEALGVAREELAAVMAPPSRPPTLAMSAKLLSDVSGIRPTTAVASAVVGVFAGVQQARARAHRSCSSGRWRGGRARRRRRRERLRIDDPPPACSARRRSRRRTESVGPRRRCSAPRWSGRTCSSQYHLWLCCASPSGRFSELGMRPTTLSPSLARPRPAACRARPRRRTCRISSSMLAAGLDGDAAGVERESFADQHDRRLVFPCPPACSRMMNLGG